MRKSLDNMPAVGALIRKVRREQGLNQDSLAGISGTGRRFISDLENGKETVEMGKALRVARALGLSLYIYNQWERDE